jgi:autotransporter translocation and assembly factor TamB
LKGPWTDQPPTGVGPLSFEVSFATSETLSKLQATVIDELKPSIDLLDVQGTIALGSRALGALLRKPNEIPTHLGSAPLQVAVKTQSLPLLALGRVFPQLASTRGTAQLDADLHGSLRALRGKLQLALSDFAFPHRRLGSIALQAEARDAGLTLHADLTPPPAQGGHLNLNASWGLRPEELANAAVRRAAPLRADLQATDLPLALVLGKRSDLQGIAKATAEMRGSLAVPTVKAQLALTSLTVDDKPAGELAGNIDWNGKILLARFTGDQPAGGKIDARADLPFTPAGLGSGPLTASLKASAFDISIFEPVLLQTKTVRALGGVLDADLAVKGTRADPQPNGTIQIARGELALAGLGELQHIQISARVSPDSLVIDQLAATSGGGPLKASLSATRSDKNTFALSGRLETNRFGIYVDDQLRALLNSQSDLKGTMTFPGPGADVTVSVRDAWVRIPTLTQRQLAPTGMDPEIHILSWRTPSGDDAAPEPSPPKPRPPIYLRISAPGPIEVRGPDVRLDAKANLAVRIASGVDLTGMVAVERGEINALGRAFMIYRANIRFGDAHGDFAPPDSGRLDVQAGQEIDGYRVSMVILGRIGHPVPQLSSDPPLPKARISQLLASGSSDEQNQAGSSSLVSNLFVEGLKDWLKIRPPLDVLTVDPNRLEAGKRITSKLYVGVIDNYAVTDPRINGTEVHARYDLGHHFALDGRYGTSEAGSFDLQWRHNW